MSKIIKIALGDDMRRKTYQDISFDAFKQDVASTFNLQNGSFIIKFQDKLINSDEQFLFILNNTQSTIKFDIQKRSFDDLYEDEVEIKVKEVPVKQNIPENIPENTTNNNVKQPKMPNIFSTLFGNMPQFGQQPQQQSNPLSMLMGFLPNLMGGNNNNNNNSGSGLGGMFPALMQNLPNIIKILTENLPKEKLQELIVSILKTIPREQLLSILKTALSSPQVQESIISTLMSSLDNMMENPKQEIPKQEIPKQEIPKQENPINFEEQNRIDELKRQEETRKRIEELKRQQEEIKKKQEEELLKQEQIKIEEQKRIEEENRKKKLEEFLKQQDNLKKQYEDQRRIEEEKKKEEERLRYEQMIKEQEELKKRIEEENRLKLEELRRQEELQKQEELRKQSEEQQRKLEEQQRKQLEELQKQEEEKKKFEENQRKQEEMKRNQFMQILQNNGIPYECFRNAEEIGLIESYGIEKVVQLLIKHRGNVELVANELFN